MQNRRALHLSAILAAAMWTAAHGLPCKTLPASTESVRFAASAYNCRAALAELNLLALLDASIDDCPVGLRRKNGLCQDECEVEFFAVVNNANDARLCGCVAPGGCALRDRELGDLLASKVRSIVVIPQEITQKARVVPCETLQCTTRGVEATLVAPTVADMLQCEAHGVAYQHCPVCPAVCSSDANSRCSLTPDGSECISSCRDGYFFDAGQCRRCRRCAPHETETSACRGTAGGDTQCAQCPVDMVQAGDGAPGVCVPCPNNTGRPERAQRCRPTNSPDTDEQPCPVDFEWDERAARCAPCPLDMVRPNALGEARCRPARADRLCGTPGYVAVDGSAGCDACAPRTVPTKNRTACERCPDGHLADGDDCVQCPLGSYLPGPEAQQCEPCLLGSGVVCAPGRFLDRCARTPPTGACTCSCRVCALSFSDADDAAGEMVEGGSACRISCKPRHRRVERGFEWRLTSNATAPSDAIANAPPLFPTDGRAHVVLSVSEWVAWGMRSVAGATAIVAGSEHVYEADLHRARCVLDARLLPSTLPGHFVLSSQNITDTGLYACEDLVDGGVATIRDAHLESSTAVQGDPAQRTLRATALRNHLLSAWRYDDAPDACTFTCMQGYTFEVEMVGRQAVWRCSLA